MVDSVTQLLAWIDHAPRMDEINWVDNTPYWRDEENMFERLENQDEFLRSVDAHRIRQTKRLIGHRLPGLYETTFGEKFTVSRSDDGTPGLRFVIGVLRHAGITRENGTELSIDTVIKYRSMAKKDLLRQQRNLPPPPLYKRD